MKDNILNFETVTYNKEKNALEIIDQTLLPNEVRMLYLDDVEDIWKAINILQVRGAPAIGVAAAIGLAVVLNNIDVCDKEDFSEEFYKNKEYLATSRPTAVNLFWALDRMVRVFEDNNDKEIAEIKKILLEEALSIREEDIDMCRKIAQYGLELFEDGFGILTHCNAGQLATVKYGTALGPIHLGVEKGYKFKVFCDETRPLLQGARLSSFELMSDGVDTTVICDNMVSQVMKNGWIDAVIVGADRIAANGDACNKIGTSGVAILAKHYSIPFYIAAPTSTIDISLKDGSCIPIEERDAEEISCKWYEKRMIPQGVKTYNPAFDVTDNDLINGIITEYGVLRAPYEDSIKKLFDK